MSDAIAIIGDRFMLPSVFADRIQCVEDRTAPVIEKIAVKLARAGLRHRVH